jgi:M6 family metalloprotease-like protein/uncharacterized repeat protein (TIGR02543 family)
MAMRAADSAYADGCDFTRYDINGDGEVDGIHIIYAGYGAEANSAYESTRIWAHKWTIGNTSLPGQPNRTPPVYDDIEVNTYSCSPELRDDGRNGRTDIAHIGTMAHELSHVFGMPDFYDTDGDESTGESVTPDNWDIMATGSWNDDGRTPAGHNPWSKELMGWVPITTLTRNMTNVTLPDPAIEGKTYKVLTSTPNEYFLLENRQKSNKWDAYLASSGMLIYHVDETGIGLTDAMNQNPSNRRFYIKQAGCTTPNGCSSTNNNYLTYRARDPYPQSGGRTVFTDYPSYTIPNARSKSGQTTDQPITNITHNTAEKTISFNYAFTAGALDNLSVKRGTTTYDLLPAFRPDSLHYRCTVPHSIDNVDITYLISSKWILFIDNTVVGAGNKILSAGNNSFTVHVDADFGATDYTVDIFRRNNDSTLSALAVNDGTTNYDPPNFAPAITTYTINVPYNIATINITGTPTDANAAVYGNVAGAPLVLGPNTFSITVKADDTAYQQTYTIIVDRNATGILIFAGEAINIPPTTTAIGHTIMRPTPDPVRSDYTFDSWCKDSLLTATWNFFTDIATSDTTIIYARWLPYRVVLFVGDDMDTMQTTVPIGHPVARPSSAPERPGYTFDNWYNGSNFAALWNFETDLVYADTAVIYAKWIPYRVVLFVASGAETDTMETTVPIGCPTTRPSPDPVRKNYIIENWYRDAAYTAVWNFEEDMVTADTTFIYAKWDSAGVVQFVADAYVSQQIVPIGKPVAQPLTPSRSGYIFDKWYKDTAAAHIRIWNFAMDYVEADTVFVYGKWFVAVYVKFVDDIDIPLEIVPFGERIPRPMPDPVREGRTFDGWYEDSARTIHWNFATMNAVYDTTFVYAKWKTDASTAVDAPEEESFLIYPTVASEQLTILLPNSEYQLPVSIYNMSGTLIETGEITSRQTIINISHLPAGAYIVEIGGKTVKVVKK